jgi:hypothetical protein
MSADDRKMFSPLRRGEAVSPEAKLVAILDAHEAGMTAAALADALVHAGLAVGTRAPMTKRIVELLESLEQAGRVERTPDGRYRRARAHN